MLENNIKTQLKGYFQRLQQPIVLSASLDGTAKSDEMASMLAEIADLSPLITLDKNGQAPRRPTFAISRPNENPRVFFSGIPMGHEFTSLVLAMLQIGGHPPKIEADMLKQIPQIKGTFKFETFVSLSCHNCPDVVQALNLMATLNPNIQSTMIDGGMFQSEIEERKIMAVPTVLLNGEPFGQGRMTLEEIVGKIDKEANARNAEKLNNTEPYDVLIVGGGPAGASAAVYAARKGIRTGIVTERFGGQVLDTLGIDNLISVPHTDGPKLVAALEQHVKEYDVDVINLQRAESLLGEGADGLATVRLTSGAILKAKSVIISTGARWREMNVAGEKEYRGKGVAYCPHCDGPLFKGKPVAVIGGGNSGVEAAIDLAGIVEHVTLIEYDQKLRADAILQNKLKSLGNVTIITNAQTAQVNGNGEKVTGLTYQNRTDGKHHNIILDGIFVQIGLLPNTDWLKGTLALSLRGEIEVDSKGQTSLPGIFAAGDATTTPFKQIIISMGEGAKAALGAFDYLIRRPETNTKETKTASTSISNEHQTEKIAA